MSYIQGRETLSLANAKISEDYEFFPNDKIVEIQDIDFKEVLLIINTTDNITIYNPLVTSLTGSRINTKIKLDFDTTSMSKSDDLLIIYQSDEIPQTDELLAGIFKELRAQTKFLRKIYGS